MKGIYLRHDGVIARFVSRIALREDQPTERFHLAALAILRADVQLIRSLPWYQFSHNEDLRDGDHFLVERQAARPVSLSVSSRTVPRRSFQPVVGFLTVLYSPPQSRRLKK